MGPIIPTDRSPWSGSADEEALRKALLDPQREDRGPGRGVRQGRRRLRGGTRSQLAEPSIAWKSGFGFFTAKPHVLHNFPHFYRGIYPAGRVAMQKYTLAREQWVLIEWLNAEDQVRPGPD